jgi:hypothetical protein
MHEVIPTKLKLIPDSLYRPDEPTVLGWKLLVGKLFRPTVVEMGNFALSTSSVPGRQGLAYFAGTTTALSLIRKIESV